MSLEAAEVGDWKIEFQGLVDRPASISAADLAKLPQEEIELVLQCSGNGRARFSQFAKADGAQWQHGAMGNVKFKGVKFKTVLDHLRISPRQAAKFVAAEGMDSPDKPDAADFEHSLPLEDVVEKSLLALSLNGEKIPKVHGGPVRLVTPGYYATMNVKWLSRVRFEEHESSNHHHAGRYRTPLKPIPPGSKFATALDNSEPNWNMRIKSVIFAPLEGSAPFRLARLSCRAWLGTTERHGLTQWKSRSMAEGPGERRSSSPARVLMPGIAGSLKSSCRAASSPFSREPSTFRAEPSRSTVPFSGTPPAMRGTALTR